MSGPDEWHVPQAFNATFDTRLSAERGRLLALYERGKTMQWNASDRIDWSQDLDPENPQQLPPETLPIFGSPLYARMSPRERTEVLRQHQAWTTSQFMHGEQGAMICAAKTVQQIPDLDAKLYAATQVVDEARHVEAYQKLVVKFGASFPMTAGLRTLLDQILRDPRWDMTYLGMQVVIEGLALAAFARIRDQAQNPLAASVNAFVMEDEARHVAFGSLSLRDYYPHLTQAERDEREDFLIEACSVMRERFDAIELWRHLDLPLDECFQHINGTAAFARTHDYLFSRIVPTVRAIGLFGPKIRRAFAMMGVLHLGAADPEAAQADDARIARDLDGRRAYVAAVAGTG